MTTEQGSQPWTILKVINWATEFFTSKGIESARIDSQLLLGHVLNLTKVELYTSFDKPLTKSELAQFKTLLLRRANREPLAYILGSKGFWKYDFKVSKATLIPRPDTEILVERALDILKSKSSDQIKVLDIGTGTGCLAITINLENKYTQVDAIDISSEALEIAVFNAKNLGANVNFIKSDLFSALKGKTYDLIISNPPYITKDELKMVAPEIRDYEPHSALVSDNNGMNHYTRILMEVKAHLNPGGILLLEIGDNREKDLSEIAKKYFFHINTHPDLNGSPRLLELREII